MKIGIFLPGRVCKRKIYNVICTHVQYIMAGVKWTYIKWVYSRARTAAVYLSSTKRWKRTMLLFLLLCFTALRILLYFMYIYNECIDNSFFPLCIPPSHKACTYLISRYVFIEKLNPTSLFTFILIWKYTELNTPGRREKVLLQFLQMSVKIISSTDVMDFKRTIKYLSIIKKCRRKWVNREHEQMRFW